MGKNVMFKENGISLSCRLVSTTVWLHHLDFSETPSENNGCTTTYLSSQKTF